MKRQSRHYVAYRKVYNRLIKYVVLLFIFALFGFCSVYLYFYSESSAFEVLTRNEQNRMDLIRDAEMLKTKRRGFNGKKYVHIDLKGAAPKISYYEYIFELFSNVSIDGVLLEYEDMFPYDGKLKNISAFNSYSKNDIKFINDLAEKYSLEIIPLVQTFGHMEFVLKLEEFKELREVPQFPQELCPSRRESIELVSEMLSQIIEAHPRSTKIHIGADETRALGRCRECINKMKLWDIPKENLYIDHVNKVRELIRKKHSNWLVLFWDDQLREMTIESVRKLNETTNGVNDVVPVVWQYDSDVFYKLEPALWQMYSRVFKNVWIASAFKGATGVDRFAVDVAHYIQNHRAWLSVTKSYENSLNFDAIIMTGWQRYDHFSILCELLPVALPSLVINVEILNAHEEYRMGAPKKVAEIFKCSQPYALMGLSFGTPKCNYPGSEILENVYRLYQLKYDFGNLNRNSVVRGWLNAFNTYFNVLSRDHILKIASHLNHFAREIDEIELEISKALLEIYDVYTKDEWIATFITPLKNEIDQLLNAKQKSFKNEVWPRRPFNKKSAVP